MHQIIIKKQIKNGIIYRRLRSRIIKKNNISQKEYMQNVILSHIITRYLTNKYRIIHINGCRHDNRKSNLRITSQPITKIKN